MDNKVSYEEPFRSYALKYFEIHADHRLRVFQFYIVLSALIIGGFFTILKTGENYRWLSLLGFLVTFLSIVFSKMDRRTRMLVKNAEAALKYLDDQHHLPDMEGKPHVLRLFTRDDAITQTASRWPLVDGHFSYSRVFRWVFVVFGLTGSAVGLICLFFLPA